MRVNGIPLRDGERSVYGRAADRARAAYLRKHGSAAVSGKTTAAEVRKHAAAWRLEHGAAYESAADRAGTAAVKKWHTARGNTTRLAELGLLAPVRRTRKPAAPAVTVADVAAASDGRVVLVAVSTPDQDAAPSVAAVVSTESAPVTRAARKLWRRELADRMRAAGIEPRGEAWRRAADGESLDSIARDVVAAVGGAS